MIAPAQGLACRPAVSSVKSCGAKRGGTRYQAVAPRVAEERREEDVT